MTVAGITLRGLLLISALVLASACGSGGGGGGGGAPTGGGNGGGEGPKPGPTAPANCDEAWAQHVQRHPKGMVLEYRTTMSPSSGPSRTTKEKITVIESNDTVVKMTMNTNGQSVSTTHTKDEFLASCRDGAAMKPTQPEGFEILAQREERVTVPAGTFNAYYVKARSERNMGNMPAETVTESWSAVEFLYPVKSVTIIKIKNQLIETRTVRELVSVRH